MRYATIFLTTLLIGAAAPVPAALVVVEEPGDGVTTTVYKMTVTSAAEPVPALTHRLVLRETEYKPGNAALYYLRSFPEGGDVHEKFKRIQKDFKGDDICGSEGGPGWYSIELPLEQLDRGKLRRAASYFDTTVRAYVRPASERRDCSWGHDQVFELKGPDIYAYLLPEIQSLRNLSRAIMLRTRVAVADCKYDEAIDLLRMNYRLGENVARSPFLVSCLVGIAVGQMGNGEVIELIAAKDSPNLYWALAELPRPYVSMQRSTRIEMSLITRVVPVLDDAENAEHSPEEWARLIARDLAAVQSGIGSGPQLNEVGARYATAGFGLVAYPDAKRRLIASGMDAGRVEAMPVGQVLAIDAIHEFRRIADGLEKWYYVPWRIARERSPRDESEMMAGGPWRTGFGGLMAQMLLPALSAARTAEERFNWELGAIQTVEALRMHAAVTGGFPKSLDEVTCVPLPENPATGKPYVYRLDGAAAIVELPASDKFPGTARRFELTLAK